MAKYSFCLASGADAAADTIECDCADDVGALRDAVRTAAEMLKEQADSGAASASFGLSVADADGRTVGEVAIRTTVHAGVAA